MPVTLRNAIDLAMESLPGAIDSNVLQMKHEHLRAHLLAYVKDFAHNRGVIFDDADVLGEIDARLQELKGLAIARTKTPR